MVAQGVPVCDNVRLEVDIDTYPVCVAIIDGDTKVVVEKGVEAVSLWVDPKPRERVVAKKGAPWEDGRVEVRGEAEEGVCVGRRWREAGKEGAQIRDAGIVEPSGGGQYVEEIRRGVWPVLPVALEGDLDKVFGGGVDRGEPSLIRGVWADSPADRSKAYKGCLPKECKGSRDWADGECESWGARRGRRREGVGAWGGGMKSGEGRGRESGEESCDAGLCWRLG